MKLPKKTKPKEASPGNFFHFNLIFSNQYYANEVVRSFTYWAVMWKPPIVVEGYEEQLPYMFGYEDNWKNRYPRIPYTAFHGKFANVYKACFNLTEQEWEVLCDEALTLLLLCDPRKEHEHIC